MKYERSLIGLRLGLKGLWPFPCCLAAAWLGVNPYASLPGLRALLAVPAGLLLAVSLRIFLKKRRQLYEQDHLRRLLEHLLVRMTAGATLEKAFIEAPVSLEHLLGRRSAALSELRQVARQLLASQSLDPLLPQLAACFPGQAAAVFFRSLPGLRKSGGQLCPFIRIQLRMVSEELTLLRDLGAETTQRRTEAAIMAVMPFIMTLMLQQSSAFYVLGQDAGHLSVAGMAVAFVLAVTAASLVLAGISPQPEAAPARSWPGSAIMPALGKHLGLPGRILDHAYQFLLPETYSGRLRQILHDAPSAPGNPRQPHQAFFARKAGFCLLGLAWGAVFLIVWPRQFFWMAGLPVILCLLQDLQLFSLARDMLYACRLEYPVLINLIAALLQAGLSLHMAFQVVLDSLRRSPDPTGNRPRIALSFLQKDLREISSQIQLGLPVSRTLESIATACPEPEIQAALLYLCRYEKTGGREILDLLQMQSAICWSLYRQARRRQMEQRSLQLLLPMVLALLSILLTAILPAWSSLSTF